MIKKTIKLRNRGQITIPKDFLNELGANENDLFVVYYDANDPKKIVLELIETNKINFTDELEKYIIADLKLKGYDNQTIVEKLPIKKKELEKKYSEYLREIEEENDFINCDKW